MPLVDSDAFPKDAYKWAGSGALHALAGLVAVHILLALSVPAVYAVPGVAVAYLFVIEVWDQGFRLPMDSLLDGLMVLCGALYPMGTPAAQWGALIVGGVTLAAGSWVRR